MFNKLVTKKSVLILAIGGVVLAELFARAWAVGLCEPDNYSCAEAFSAHSGTLLIFWPALFISLITYWMRNEVFLVWRNFAAWWIPLTIFMALIASNDSSQSLPSPSEKGIVVIGMSLLFTIISIVIIVAKRNRLQKSK